MHHHFYIEKGVFTLASPKKKSARLWALKIFITTMILSAGVSVVAELFLSDMGLWVAILVLLILVLLLSLIHIC